MFIIFPLFPFLNQIVTIKEKYKRKDSDKEIVYYLNKRHRYLTKTGSKKQFIKKRQFNHKKFQIKKDKFIQKKDKFIKKSLTSKLGKNIFFIFLQIK